jgi:hypothetical protein
MSRAATGDVVLAKPTSNIYTVLAIIATLVNVSSFILIFLRYTAVFGDTKNLFQP